MAELPFVLTPIDDKPQVPTSPGDTDPELRSFDFEEFTLTPEEVDAELRPPTTIGGVEIPGAGAVQDFFNGFNHMLAETLVGSQAANLNVANQIYGWLAGDGFLDKPINAREAIRKSTKALGLTYDEPKVSQLISDIGEETFQQALISAVMIGSAGSMQAINTGRPMIDAIIRQVGEFSARAPGATIVSNVGAGAGAEVGHEIGGPTGELIGSVLGAGAGATAVGPGIGKTIGAVGGALSGALGGLASLGPMGAIVGGGAGGLTGKRVGEALAEKVLRTGIPVEKAALMGKNLPQEATTFAREAVKIEQQRIDQEIADTFARLRGSGEPQLEAEALSRSVDRAYELAQARASQLWDKVDQNQKVGISNARAAAAEILRGNPKTAPELLPTDIMGKIAALARQPEPGKAPLPKYGAPGRAPRPRAKVPTLRDLRGIQMLITGRLRTDATLTDTTRKYLTDLNAAIDSDILAANPQDSALQTAREYTRWLHDHLTRGPLGKFSGAQANAYQQSIRGDLEAAKALINESQAGRAISEVAARLNMPQLEQEAAQFARAHLAQQAGGDAAKLQREMAKPTIQRFMQAFPARAAEFNADMTYLSAALADEKMLKESAFRHFAGLEPQEAIRSVFTGTQKVARVQQIKAGLMDNADALRGFKDGVLGEFYAMTGGAPSRMSQMLSVKDLRGALAEVLGPEDMKRLERMVKAGVRLEEQGALAGKRTMLGSLFRYAGAGIARAMGARTIQQTGTGATVAENAITSLMSAAPARDMFTKAITDPKMERLLYSRVPETLREMQATQELVKGVIGLARGLQTDPRTETKR